MSHFVYKLVPPRPTFGPGDMSDDEAAIMGRHSAYWSGLLADGTAVIFGPVVDPAGNWGLGVVRADSEDAVRAISAADPAVTSGLARVEILPMPVGIGCD
ncbi:YciI family protein [Gordonia McavH-238-E]|uniref:YciI family protein n=1 Tax=Gordonia sp. McavH-238-E TaxID=2917736 RepID=UPI001EF4B43D|nr:YciI family protein [Gordonia sp. McavH-238-E]MCG7633862.1 YciI family protein [Gordonia sp. McavH-238-E]